MLYYYALNLQIYPLPGGSGGGPNPTTSRALEIEKDESDIQEMAEMFVIYKGACNV